MKLSFLALVFLLFSCKKDRSCETCNAETGFKDATILYTGPIATDGCDWVVKIGADQYYHPGVLATEFKQNELDVQICYEVTADQFHCGIAGTGMTVIRVLGIKK
ncbi:MAG: hypothetical protein ACXWV2_06020 [Chitinophagaceae bacterium]